MPIPVFFRASPTGPGPQAIANVYMFTAKISGGGNVKNAEISDEPDRKLSFSGLISLLAIFGEMEFVWLAGVHFFPFHVLYINNIEKRFF